MAAQTKDVCLAFNGNRPLLLQGHIPRFGPTVAVQVRSQVLLLITGCFSLSSSLQFCLFIVPTFFCFSFSSISAHLLLLLVLRVSECLSAVVQECYVLLVHCGPGQGSSQGPHGARVVVVSGSLLSGPIVTRGVLLIYGFLLILSRPA